MNSTKRILIIPCLTPLLIVALISILNINKQTRIRLLTYTSQPTSIGLIMLVTSFGSAICTSLILQSINQPQLTLKRDVHYTPNLKEDDNNYYNQESRDVFKNQYKSEDMNAMFGNRDPREPTPTISVPYRVIVTPPVTDESVENEYEQDYTEESLSSVVDKDDLDITKETYILDDWDHADQENW